VVELTQETQKTKLNQREIENNVIEMMNKANLLEEELEVITIVVNSI
jgi:hypothetical protein